ncbi:M13 family metallopeptidase [Candidatus Nomurabacteria bacterium]|nr:M13 family metallopeptidase [Candidatus Nomurabacteria bacterium]
MQKRLKKGWGFDTSAIDRSVRPEDDFYHYANGSWLKNAKIPPEESRWGSFITLRYDTELQLKTLVETTKEAQIRNMYASALNMPLRNKKGIKPIEGLRKEIAAIKTPAQLQKTLITLSRRGLGGMWGEMIEQDLKNTTRYALFLWQGGLGMPDRDYYLLDKPEQVRVRTAYIKHIKNIVRLGGGSAKEASRVADVVMRIETRLAKASMPKEDMRDPHKIYHKYTFKTLQRLSPAIEWRTFLTGLGVPKIPYVLVGQPEFFKEISQMLKEIPLSEWQTYLDFHLLNNAAGMLSEQFVKENFWFYSQVLAGTKKMKPLWRRALGATGGTLGELLGKAYVAKHFPPAAKKATDELVSDLFTVYESRIKALSWMSGPTKKKAIKKLRAMERKIAYPKRWKNYKGLVIKKDDYAGNVLRATEFEHKRELRKLGRPIDRHEWLMTPQTVNAYFNPPMNEIVFPAAILQWPFFDSVADAALNYAGIGSVIGHEMTHGFDDEGSKYDHNGNLRNWWSADDRARFEKRAELIVAQADKHEVEPGVHMNGKLTLGENIADLGGLVIAWDAYQKHLDKTGRYDIEGLSPEQRFFLAYAQMERELRRPESAKLAALTDPHAEASFRINNPLSNFTPFIEMLEVKKRDKLYRDPKERAEIW